MQSYDRSLHRVVQSVFNFSQKPPVGEPPKYVNAVFDTLPKLSKIDSIIFETACKIYLERNIPLIETHILLNSLDNTDISREEIFESLEILDSNKYIEVHRELGGPIPFPFFSITTYGLDLFAQNNIENYKQIKNEICLCILNENLILSQDIAKKIDVPVALVEHILTILEDRGLIQTSKIDEQKEVHDVSPRLRRMLI